jgi:hypothetical protein
MKFKTLMTVFLFVTFSVGQLLGQDSTSGGQTSGPLSGTLVIAGGGRLSDAIIDRFIELAGGAAAKIVLVPTAAGADSYSDSAGDMFWSMTVHSGHVKAVI